MDISICFADFPTEAIGKTTVDYRQLGIGYANLGALLMAMGLGYDSEGGRSMAAAITSLMTGTSYKPQRRDGRGRGCPTTVTPATPRLTSGSCASTRRPTTSCVAAHRRRASAQARHAGMGRRDLRSVRNGFRNAQASVLAPTGTIGFMMDCDTTGIEPDFSLVKFKKLVGGGSMQIVNQTIPRALTKLGYQPSRSRRSSSTSASTATSSTRLV
jgi:ribonucleoside-diphosphate reductase alpha chain